MTAKHTPGPWLCESGGRVRSTSLNLIASAWPPYKIPEDFEPTEGWLAMYKRNGPLRSACDAEMEANARLIAAAPELLEALEGLHQYFEDGSDEQKMICAALAKARE